MRQPSETGALVAEALAIVGAAQRRDVQLRLIGGIAIYVHSGPSHGVGPWRTFGDIDFIGRHADVKSIKSTFEQIGYLADPQVNTLHGRYRLVFEKRDTARRIDVLLDVFQMCHRIPLIDRLGLDTPTVSLADLLLTKLQILELNRKDADDVAFLLAAHPVTGDDREAVNGEYVAALCARDWGLYRTVSGNITKLLDTAPPEAVNRATLQARLRELQERLAAAPKSRKWRLRAKIGDRYPWYEEVEDVER